MEDNHDNFRQPYSHSFFEGTKNTEVRGGHFATVGGSVYQGAQPQTGPVQRPQQQPQNASFFKNSDGTLIRGGLFTAVGHDLHVPSESFQQGGSEFVCPVCFVILT